MRTTLTLFILFTNILIASPITKIPFPIESLQEACVQQEEQFIHSLMASSQEIEEHIIERSKTLEERLNQKVFGQEAAIRETANAIVRYAAGISEPTTPIASLLYCGPSGVGKTELAKQLCNELYGNSRHFIRINLSEFIEPHSISRLIGAPPGYIGYDKGGALSNRLMDNPYSVVLLDEIEKGHPQILKLFMHVFDAGYFTSSRGEDVDCRHAIFILTSNLAASEIADLHALGLTKDEILRQLEPYFMEVLSPELYNRVDCMVFSPLPDEIREKLIRKILLELNNRLYESKKIQVIFHDSLIEFLLTYTLDPKLGARPLKRLVDKQLATVFAKAIIDGTCIEEDVVLCAYEEGHLLLEVLLQPQEGHRTS